MPTPRKLLSTTGPASPPSDAIAVNSDAVIILAALLCAVICGAGLALVARCACLRRSRRPSSGPPLPPPPPPNRGLKKKVLRALPKLVFDGSLALPAAECPICLADFACGDEVRVLPQCGHGFHAGCVDRWLESRSSCPSCRRILDATTAAAAPASSSPASPRCQTCGASPASTAAPEEEGEEKRREGRRAATDGFLP